MRKIMPDGQKGPFNFEIAPKQSMEFNAPLNVNQTAIARIFYEEEDGTVRKISYSYDTYEKPPESPTRFYTEEEIKKIKGDAFIGGASIGGGIVTIIAALLFLLRRDG